MRVAASLLCLAALSAPGNAGESVVDTPFAVRQAAQELLDELGRGGHQAADLVERGIGLITENPEAMLPDKDGAVPMPEILGQRFAAAGLGGPWQAAAGAAASRAVTVASGDETALTRVAIAWPRTPAGRFAARRLADRAWDRGRLGAFVDFSIQAGDRDEPLRAPRLDAARGLVPGGDASPPQTLDGLDPLWTADLGDLSQAPTPRRRINIPGQGLPIPRWGMTSGHGLMAMADGRRMAAFEPLTGHLLFVTPLGEGSPSPAQARPLAVAGGFVAAGLSGGAVRVLAVGLDGTVRWRTEVTNDGWMPGFSNLAADDLHVVLAITGNSEEGTATTLVGLDLRTGKEQFRRLVTRDAGGRFGGFENQDPRLSPAIARMGGGWIICSNQGSLVRTDADGRPRRVWAYPSTGRENPWERPPATRPGAIMSEPGWTVATPADNRDQTFIIDADGRLRAWRGDGANGNVVAVSDGVALLAGKRVAALTLATQTVAWTSKSGVAEATAWRDDRHLLLTGRDGLLLLDPATGLPQSPGRGLAQQSAGCSEGVLVIAEGGKISGFGQAKALIDSLQRKAAADPKDPLPLLGLAQLAQASRDDEGALRYLDQARARGAADAGLRTADLLRRRITATIGGPDGARWLDAFDRNAEHEPSLRGEAAWWKGRDRFLRGDALAARQAASAVLTGPDRELVMPGGARLSLHAAARILLGQVDPTQRPGWLAPVPGRTSLGSVDTAWTVGGRRGRTTLAGFGLAVGYMDGVLAAHRISDGGEAWIRTPVRPLLGVIGPPPGAVDKEGGVPVGVLPGSSAASAGLADGDRILRLNGQEMDDFHSDLRPTVQRMKPGDPFMLVIRRGVGEVTLKGRLGGEPVEPVALGTRTLLVRATLQQHQREPGRSDNLLIALDLASGRELFTKGLPADTQDPDPAPQALLTADDLVLLPDGPDLIAVDAWAPVGAAERWRLPDLGNQMSGARLFGRLLCLPNRAARECVLVDTIAGSTVARIPLDGEAAPVLDGTDLALIGADKLPRLWDLATGTLRWTGTVACGQLLRLQADQLLTLSDSGQVVVIERANGQVRRTLGELTAVQDRGGASGDPILLQARHGTRPVLVALEPSSGTAAWELPIPAGCEVALVAPGVDGAAIVFRQGDRISAMRLDRTGAIRTVASLPPGSRAGAWAPLANGLLGSGADGLRVWPVSTTTAIRIPCRSVSSADDLLNPAALGSERIALGRIDSHLIIAATGNATVHLGEGTGIDGVGVRVEFQANGDPRIVGPLDGWRLASVHRSGAIRALVLLPPLGRTPGTGLRLRTILDGDDQGLPWWWGGAWSTVDGAP